MRNLIKADLVRILKTKMIYIGTVFALLTVVFKIVQCLINAGFNATGYVTGVEESLDGFMFPIYIIVPIFLAVFSNELSSKSMQCLIGHGVSRFRLLLAKFIDCVIVTCVTFFIYFFFSMMLGLALGAGMNALEFGYISGMLMVWLVKSLGYATFSMIILYWTKNVGFATFTDVFLLVAGGSLLSIFNNIPVIKFYHLDKYIFEGMLIKANVSLQLGQADAWFWIFIAIVRICLFSLIISFLLFRKKELDF